VRHPYRIDPFQNRLTSLCSTTFGLSSYTMVCLGAVTSTHMSTTTAHGGRPLTGMLQRQVAGSFGIEFLMRMCFSSGVGRDCPDGFDGLPPGRRAVYAHIQSRYSRRGARTPAMARKCCGVYSVVFFSSARPYNSSIAQR
jgi:hypothetical protein